MKNLKMNLLAVLFLLSAATNAQQAFNEGKIIFEISYPNADIPDQQLAMMPTEMTMYLKRDKSRVEMSMGMGMSTVVINDNKAKVATTLMDVMGNKIATKVTEEDVKKENEKQPDVKVSITDETKDIAGYKCKKAVVTDGEGGSYDLYYCEDITVEGGNWSQKGYENIKGLPLQYSINQGGMNMQMTAKKVSSEKVDDGLFRIPTDYKEMSKEELKKMFGGE
ncbi:MAG: DUF4412 domain-containing protein [Bacteroidia bacterium]|nr:DUF4412 domain-containing protein [Bacteroidia bacterium]MCZ2277106.1 DUF4412 domain-containing protein [Bacteroidia bacterium]